MIKAVVFDIGEVVDAGDWDSFFGELAKALGVPEANIREVRQPYRKMMMCGKITAQQDMTTIARALGVDAKEVERAWRRLYHAHFRVNPAVIALIRRLKRRYHVATFTNVSPIHHLLRHEKRRYAHFGTHLISCEEGMMKPEPRFYRLLLKRLDLPAQDIVFIDDKEENLAPARALGIKTIRFTNAVQLQRDLRSLGFEA